jgi:hypothetical protein
LVIKSKGPLMTTSIAVQCPSCQATLKLKNEAALGKRVPCPKCGEPFVLKRPAKPKPKSPPPKKPEPEESLVDFTEDIDEYEDYEASAPAPRQAPRGLPPVTNRREAPAMAAAASDAPAVPKKRKKKRSESSGPPIPAGFIGMIVCGAIGGAVGAGIWAAVGYFSHYEVGWIAWGVGVLVGFGVRLAADDADGTTPGVIAAGLAIAAVLAGKYLVVSLVIDNLMAVGPAADRPVPPPGVDMTAVKAEILARSFGGWDLLWFGLAAMTAYKIGAGIEDGE